jgi:hypothetical protein
MKTLTRYILLITFIATLTSAGVHKYYVSVWQFDHKPDKERLEITGRIFIDDLEKMLKTKYGKTFNLATDKELPETTATIQKYLADKISVKVNGKLQTLSWLARETDDDILVCYLTVPAPKKLTSIEVRNTVLQEIFREQQNMVHTTVNGERRTLLLTYDTPSGTLNFYP